MLDLPVFSHCNSYSWGSDVDVEEPLEKDRSCPMCGAHLLLSWKFELCIECMRESENEMD